MSSRNIPTDDSVGKPLLNASGWMNNEYAKAARLLDIDVDILIENRVFRATKEGKSVFFVDAIAPLNDGAVTYLAEHKGLTKECLVQENIPVPEGISLSRKQYRSLDVQTITALGFKKKNPFPLVVKPALGTMKGEGVVTNILDVEALFNILEGHFQKYFSVLIEEYFDGMGDYRLLILDGKLLAAAQRFPAEIVGDGYSTIQELIHIRDAARQISWGMRFGKIRIGRELHETLQSQGKDLQSILAKGETIRSMNIANISSGGYSVNCMDQVAPENIHFAVQATKALGLRLAGVDILCHDIHKPIGQGNGGILEVNASPGVILHYFPKFGERIDVFPDLVQASFHQ